MKVKLYIEKILKIGVGVFGFALISTVAAAQDSSGGTSDTYTRPYAPDTYTRPYAPDTYTRPYAPDTYTRSNGGIQDTRQWAGFEMHKGGLKTTIEVNQMSRERVRDGVKMFREDLNKARAAYREYAKYNPERLVSSGVADWVKQAEERYAAAKEVADLYRDIARLQMQDAVDKLTAAAQTLKYANHEFPRRSNQRTEDSLFEALGENGGLSKGVSDGKAGRGVEDKALHFKLSESLWKSSEVASEHAASGFMMDKLNVFENGRTFEFAKEDYFDDFKENYEKGTEDKVAKDILKDKESKIERLAAAAERSERRRAEKAQRNEEKIEKAEVKEEKKAEKEEQKAEKEDGDKDKKDDSDGSKKGKGK